MIDVPARHWFMHTPHNAVGLCTGTKRSASPQPLPAFEPAYSPAEQQMLRVGLLAAPEATWDRAAARLADCLCRDEGLVVQHAWDCAELGIEDNAGYDCLVLLGWPAADHDNMLSSREQIKRVGLHCRGGGSLVALRAMHADLPGWPNFAEEMFGGRQSLGGRSRMLEIQRSESAWHHPVVDGVETIIAEGEPYNGPRLSPESTVLLTARGGRHELPVAWTTRHGGGRVFCTTLGRGDDFRDPSFLRLIANAVRWAGSL